VPNKFIDEIFASLHKHLLPTNNYLPPKMYVAKTLTCKVGLTSIFMHVPIGVFI
jgi:hypothetical protein